MKDHEVIESKGLSSAEHEPAQPILQQYCHGNGRRGKGKKKLR